MEVLRHWTLVESCICRDSFDAARNLEMESLFLEKPQLVTEIILFLDNAQRENKLVLFLFLGN